MTSPLQRAPDDLGKCAEIVAGYAGKELEGVTQELRRIAGMLKPLRLGEFGVVNADGTITPTGRCRMKKR
jgi:hypothetical protein